ncbi:MAG: peptidoglycan-binding protein LysM [Flavobacteriaceae bacterium]|nr:peptidoglycan-binding protein LysM [Flavobacteriaceae bacterium]
MIFGITLLPSNTVVVEEKVNKISAEIITVKEYSHSELLFLDNNFTAFKEALAFKESQGKYTAINTLGYLGKYQFGASTLERFRIYDTNHFLKNPELQERAFIALCKVNKWILRKDIQRSVGKKINGIEITESGILAAAHLSGAGNVKKYLRSNGDFNFSDAYGSTIQYYMKRFADYNVSEIKANRKAKVAI